MKPTIAVVDDHPASCAFLEHMLKAEGHEPVIAQSARQILDRHPIDHFDIWFVDWLMPEVSGLELVRSIRASRGGDRCYIIMLTSRNAAEDLATAFEAGVDDYMAKPVGGLELRARLNAAVRLVSLHASVRERMAEVERLNEQLLKVNNRLEIMASTDALTGLLNRRAGLQRLVESWEQSCLHDRPLSVAIIDIDQFKRVNDTFGHARGDAAIRYVASVLRDAARETDFVCRLGGEEFLVTFPNTDEDQATLGAARCRERIERACCHADGQELALSISAGVASRTPDMRSIESLLRAADTALYRAKSDGRNRVVHASSDDHIARAA